MPFNIGAPELIIILVIALLILGPGKLPDVGSALGKSIREFRKATNEVQESVNAPLPSQAASAQSAAPAAPAAPAQSAPAETPAAPSGTSADRPA